MLCSKGYLVLNKPRGVFKRLRMDYDPVKGPHFNVEVGKGPSAQKWAVPWSDSEESFIQLLKRNP
jgi:hypothetical protein